MVAGFEPPEGDPDALDRAVSNLLSAESDMGGWVSGVRSGTTDALATWKGPRADSFRYSGLALTQSVRDARGSLKGGAQGLSAYAGELRRAREEIAELERQARQHLDRAEDDTAGQPADSAGATQAHQHAAAAVQRLREEAARVRRTLRSREGETVSVLDGVTAAMVPDSTGLTPDQVAQRVHAGSGVEGARAAFTGDNLTAADAWSALHPVVELGKAFVEEWGGFKPPDGMGPVSGALYALGLAGNAAGTAKDVMLKGVLQRFQPYQGGKLGPVGRGIFRQPGLGFWTRLQNANKSNAWRAKPYQALSRNRWATAGKWVGRAGTVITAATSAWEEWQQDSEYPTDERAGRAVTKGASTAAGAWAGAEGGAWVGGAIGTAICPGVGTVIGGAVGGLIGGFVGSKAGAWVGDQLKDVGGEIGDKVGDVADKVGDGVKKLKFW